MPSHIILCLWRYTATCFDLPFRPLQISQRRKSKKRSPKQSKRFVDLVIHGLVGPKTVSVVWYYTCERHGQALNQDRPCYFLKEIQRVRIVPLGLLLVDCNLLQLTSNHFGNQGNGHTGRVLKRETWAIMSNFDLSVLKWY